MQLLFCMKYIYIFGRLGQLLCDKLTMLVRKKLKMLTAISRFCFTLALKSPE